MKRYRKILIKEYSQLFEGKKQAVVILKKALKKYSDEDIKQVVDDLETRDPTSPKNKYIELLARVFVNLYEIYINRQVHVIDILSNFDDLYNSSKIYSLLAEIEKREKTIPNMQKIEEWQDFFQTITKVSQEKTKTQLKKGSLGEFKKGQDYIEIKTKNEEFDFYIPLNYEISKKLASLRVGTCEGKWCISYQKEEGYWNSYILANEREDMLLHKISIPFATSVKESVIFVFIISKIEQEYKNNSKIAVPFTVNDGSVFRADIRDAEDKLLTTLDVKNLIGSETYQIVEQYIGKNRKNIHDLCVKNLQEKYHFSLKQSTEEWVEKADTKDADYTTIENWVVWNNGTWNNGTWKIGTWLDGIWKDGIWENGDWEKGTWYAGTWKNGNWENGKWFDGVWESGEWNGGEWQYGKWVDGEWHSGTWKDGKWEDGIIYSNKFKKRIKSNINPKEFYEAEKKANTIEELKQEALKTLYKK